MFVIERMSEAAKCRHSTPPKHPKVVSLLNHGEHGTENRIRDMNNSLGL